MGKLEVSERMWRVRLGRDVPMYTNLGKYYEPFEEHVTPVSPEAMEYASQRISTDAPRPSAPFVLGRPMGRLFPPTQLLYSKKDTSPDRSLDFSQDFCEELIDSTPLLYHLETPPPLGVEMDFPAEPTRLNQTDWLYAAVLDSVGGAEETENYAEQTGGAHRYAESIGGDGGSAAPGPSERRGKKSIRAAREQAVPYSSETSASKRQCKPRVVASEDEFPHPPIPCPDDLHEQDDYNYGKQQWWSLRVLQPLLNASPRPLSIDSILSIIKKDLGLEGEAWKVFYDKHRVSEYRLCFS